MMRQIALAVLVCFCSTSYAAEPDYKIQRLDPRTVAFEGAIHGKSAEELLAVLKGGAAVLRVNSEGGSLIEGVTIGNYLHEHDIELVVDQVCASACANFLFLGAKRKSLLPGATLGFHGTSLAGMSPNQLEDLRKMRIPVNVTADSGLS